MSSRVRIEVMMLINTGVICISIRDDYAKDFVETTERFKFGNYAFKTDFDILKELMENLSPEDPGMDMLRHVVKEKDGITINGTFYEYLPSKWQTYLKF